VEEAGVRPKHDLVTVKCDLCREPLYRTDGRGVFDLERGGERVQPVQVQVNNVRLLFCGKTCAARWLIKQPIESLRSGYPLL
jgi:hypothetical protein